MLSQWAIIPVTEDGSKLDAIKGLAYEEAVELQNQYEQAFLVSLNQAIPVNPDLPKPDKKKNDRGTVLWCPYCGDWRKFGARSHQCPVCDISTRDFHVRKMNHI